MNIYQGHTYDPTQEEREYNRVCVKAEDGDEEAGRQLCAFYGEYTRQGDEERAAIYCAYFGHLTRPEAKTIYDRLMGERLDERTRTNYTASLEVTR